MRENGSHQRAKRTQEPIVFVSHEATRTGAPIFLWTLLDWFSRASDQPFEIFLCEDGELGDNFRAVARTSVGNLARASRDTILERGLRKIQLSLIATRLRNGRIQRALRPLANRKLIYLNSAISAEVLPYLPLSEDTHLVVHVHELDFALEFFLPPATRDAMIRRADLFIAASNRVRESLLSLGVPDERIKVVYECLRQGFDTSFDSAHVEQARRQLGIDDKTLVVGGSGMIEWRKGPDLFVQLGQILKKKLPDVRVRMVWLGGARYAQDHAEVLHAIKHCGLGATITIVPPVANPGPYYALFDVFALTSREDPYPIVCLEAAALGKPIVCFDSSGISEFVVPDCGFAVPHLDVDAMATSIQNLLEDASKRRAIATRAAEKARAHDVAVLGPKYKDIVEGFLA